MVQTHSNPQGKPPLKEMAKRNLRNIAAFARYRSSNSYPVTKLMAPHARHAMISRVCYFPEFNLYYARLPKCANTTIIRTLAASIDPKLDQISTSGLKTLFNRLPSAREFENAYKFVVLREPVVRAVSAWKNKGHSKVFIRKHRYAGDDSTVPSLEQFLTALRDNDYFQNAHFLPQTDMIPGPLDDFDVGMLDQLEPFLEKVCIKAIGNYGGLKSDRKVATDARKRVLEISDQERALIEELYAMDIQVYEDYRNTN